jgi:non-ribosomal peptide synthetase component F
MDFAGATHGFTVPAELVGKLRELGSRETATLFMVILTGLDVLLSRWSGQRDIVVGTPTVGRSRPELWGLLGFFNNTIALRSDLSGEPTFRELLRHVRAVVLGAMDNQEIPFDRVVREVAPDRDPSRNPIFDVMYVHQTLPPDFSFGESTFNPGRPGGEEDETPLFPGLPPGTAKFDLTFVVAERPDVEELEVALEYSTRLFDAGTAQAMTRCLLDLLWAAADDPDVSHLELPAAPPEKTEQDGSDTGSGSATDSGSGSGIETDVPEPAGPAPAAAVPAEPTPVEPIPAASVAPAPTPPAPIPAAPTPSAAVSACLRLRGDIDADALRAAFDDLTERHDVLRARFPVPTAQPLSPLARDGAARFLSVVDVSGRTDPKATARDLAAAHARTAVDPATGSPLRALLLTTGPGDHVLVVTTHRDVYDGAQPGVFFGDLLALYAARSGGLPSGPAPLPVSYDDYAQWQRRLRADGLLDEQLAYWQRRLGSLRTFETTADRPRPMRGTYTGALHGVKLPAPLARDVIQAGARERLLACIATLLSLRSGADEAHIGLTESAPDTDSPRPGRFGAEQPSPALGEIVGPFANPLTLRIDTAGDLGLGNLAAHVREVINGARGNADVPFDDVVRALRPARQPGREPLFDVTYAHHALPPDIGSAAGLGVRGVCWPGSRAARLLLPGEPGTSPYDLAWSVLEGPEPDALSISVEYRTELFDAGTAAAVTDGVVTLLRLGMREPAVPLAELWRDAASPDAGPAAGPHPA